MQAMSKADFHEAFAEEAKRMVDLVRRKNNDYTVNEDPLDNFLAVEDFDICSAETGILVRMTDKFKRATALLGGKEQMVKDEAIGDTLIDLANYAIILKLLHGRRKRPVPPMEEKFNAAGNARPPW